MTDSVPSFGSVKKSETAWSHERVYDMMFYDIFALNEMI